MEWRLAVLIALVCINTILASIVIYRAIDYCVYHPQGWRRIGACLAIMSCFWYVLNGLLSILQSSYYMEYYVIISGQINQGVMFMAAVLLLQKNPPIVIDTDDFIEILRRIRNATNEFSARFWYNQRED